MCNKSRARAAVHHLRLTVILHSGNAHRAVCTAVQHRANLHGKYDTRRVEDKP